MSEKIHYCDRHMSRIFDTEYEAKLRRTAASSIEERLAAMGDEPSKSLNLEELKAKYLGGESESNGESPGIFYKNTESS